MTGVFITAIPAIGAGHRSAVLAAVIFHPGTVSEVMVFIRGRTYIGITDGTITTDRVLGTAV